MQDTKVTNSSALSPAGDRHPGEIQFVDHVENRTWTKRAADLPPEAAWVNVNEHWRPIVLVEITGSGNMREVAEYGPNREFLEHSIGTIGPGPISSPPDESAKDPSQSPSSGK